MPGAAGVWTHKLHGAIIGIPACIADASSWIITGSMSAAAAGDGAVYTQEASEAQTSALDTVTLVRALVGTE